MKLLSISTDRKIFDKNSNVAMRQVEYAKGYEEMHIIVFSDQKFTETVLAPNLWVYPTRSGSKWKYIYDGLKLAKFIVSKRNITNITCQDPFETGLIGAIIKDKNPNIELELQIHTDIGSKYFQNFNILNRLRTRLSQFTLIRADHIRVVSNRIKDYLVKFIDSSKIEIRPIKLDIDKIKNIPVTVDLHKQYPQFERIVLMASRLEKEKNIDMAIDAFAEVLKMRQNVGLVIVGDGSQRGLLQKKVRDLGIEGSVVFLGWQNDVITYYKTCDIFLSTSWYEGYGLSLVEAHSLGIKVVSTDVGIAKELNLKIVKFDKTSIAWGIIENI